MPHNAIWRAHGVIGWSQLSASCLGEALGPVNRLDTTPHLLTSNALRYGHPGLRELLVRLSCLENGLVLVNLQRYQSRALSSVIGSTQKTPQHGTVDNSTSGHCRSLLHLSGASANAMQTAIHRVRSLLPQKSWSYEPVKQESTADGYVSVERIGLWKQSLSHQAYRKISALAITALVFLLAIFYLAGSATETTLKAVHRHQDHMLRVILPSSEPDSEVCKTVMTAAILGYSTPIVINYDKVLDDPGRGSDRERHKLNKLSEYFNRMSSSSDGDIAIVLDTPYNWFQLRPEVLMSRYYESNRKANGLLRKLFSADEVAFGSIKQDVLLSMHSSSSPSDSTFGGASSVSGHGSSGNRTRAMPNISTVIGPVESLKDLYRRAAAEADQALGSVNARMVLAEIFDRQELHREAVRQQYRSWRKRKWHSLLANFKSLRGSADKRASRRDELNNDKVHEFGLGLDYANDLTLTVDSEHDAELGGYPDLHVSVDIAASMPPFWTPSGSQNLAHKTWLEVPFVHHKETKAVPAIVSFPYSRTGFQGAHWTDFWMHPEVKSLFQEALAVPRLPVTSVCDSNGIEHTFWDPSVRFDRAGILTTDNAWADWDEICEREDTWQPAVTF